MACVRVRRTRARARVCASHRLARARAPSPPDPLATRQVRQLETADGEMRSAASERQVATEQLASTRLVLGGVERSREVIQRDSASTARQMASVRAELEQSTTEREALRQQLELARVQVEKLEGVAAELRTSAFRRAAAPAGAAADADAAADLEAGGGGGAEPELLALRGRCETQTAELTQLQRALGTASFERDEALRTQREQVRARPRVWVHSPRACMSLAPGRWLAHAPGSPTRPGCQAPITPAY